MTIDTAFPQNSFPCNEKAEEGLDDADDVAMSSTLQRKREIE